MENDLNFKAVLLRLFNNKNVKNNQTKSIGLDTIVNLPSFSSILTFCSHHFMQLT